MKLIVSALLLFAFATSLEAGVSKMERVGVTAGGDGFRRVRSGERFTPWGFNYDRDESGRLLEDYWESEWAKVEQDFKEMRQLGATVVRIHLQFGRFMRGPDEPEERALAQLQRLLKLAETSGLYLDLTGLGSYRKADVPEWYGQASEKSRWAMQARFWEAVASCCAKSPAVFCYNLMNEPISPSEPRADYLSEAFGGYHYVEVLSKDPANRSRDEITREWMATLVPAIRKHDPKRLVTVGTFFIFDTAGGLSLGNPKDVAQQLDFVSVHMYPKEGKTSVSLELMKTLKVGKPLVLEETFPLNCTLDSLKEFLKESKQHASGWIGFYWGKSIEECRRSGEIADVIMLEWLEFFQKEGKNFIFEQY